jgi:integrase
VERSLAASEVAPVQVARRWVEDSEAWLREKQAQGKYEGRNGYEALRFFRQCSEWAQCGPSMVAESDVWGILSHVGPASKTKRTYLALLGSFLASRGNWVVQESGIRGRFPNVAHRTPVVPVEDRDKVLSAAQGIERVATSLLAIGRRRVELVRAQVCDFHVDREPATYDIRGKGGHGQVTDVLILPDQVARELAWWLPLRTTWAARARRDSGALICRWNGLDLVGTSRAYVDRLLHRAELRAGVRPWPAHAWRRSTATLLRERGADWEDVSAALTHRSPETTRLYVDPLVRQRRLVTALRLIDSCGERVKS